MMFFIYPSQQLLLYETRLPYLISQNKALFRVSSFGSANSAATQLGGGLVVVGRPLLLGQRAGLLLLLGDGAGLDHGGVDACIGDLECISSAKQVHYIKDYPDMVFLLWEKRVKFQYGKLSTYATLVDTLFNVRRTTLVKTQVRE